MDWDLLGSLYITPLLVEQKIEACCFGLVPPSVLSSLLPRFLELLTSLPVSSQVLGPWILIPVDPRNISLSFPPTLSRFKCPWDPRHHQPLGLAPQLLSLGRPVGLVVNREPPHADICHGGLPCTQFSKKTRHCLVLIRVFYPTWKD